MPVTLSQIMKDIKAGKSKAIYFCEGSLWWTHLESDVIEATERGKAYTLAIAKRQGSGLVKVEHERTDPVGNGPVKEFPKPLVFMQRSIKHPIFYGKHGVNAFLKAHHQNTTTFFSNKWEQYNNLIDAQNRARR